MDERIMRRLGLLAMVAVVSACGGAGHDGVRTVKAGPGWMVGVKASSLWTVQVGDAGPRGAVLIDTAADHGRRLVEARWVDSGGDHRAIDEKRPGLVFPSAWTTEDRVYVAGMSCPEPGLEDIDAVDADPEAGCGGHRPDAVIRVLDLESASWSELHPEVPLLMGRVLNVVTPGSSSVLLGGGSPRDPDQPWLYGVDLATGATEAIDGAAGSETPTGCPVEGGAMLHAAPAFQSNGSGGDGVLTILGDRGRRSLGSAASDLVEIGCVGDGMLFWNPKGGGFRSSTLDGSRVRWSTVAGPGGVGRGASLRIAGQQNVGAAPTVWEEDEAGFHLWQFLGGSWVRVGPAFAGQDPPSVAAVIGGEIVTASGDVPVEIGVS